MKKHLQWLSLCMAVLLTALSVPACTKTETETETETIVQAEAPTYLTNIFRGTEIQISDENVYLGDPIEVSADDIVFKATKRVEHGEWGDED